MTLTQNCVHLVPYNIARKKGQGFNNTHGTTTDSFCRFFDVHHGQKKGDNSHKNQTTAHFVPYNINFVSSTYNYFSKVFRFWNVSFCGEGSELKCRPKDAPRCTKGVHKRGAQRCTKEEQNESKRCTVQYANNQKIILFHIKRVLFI